MPKENYGRNGLSNKPNTNANNSLDIAATGAAPGDFPPNASQAPRSDEPTSERDEATERPEEVREQQSE